MTFKEKWIQDHPDESFDNRCFSSMCPHDVGYEKAEPRTGCYHPGLSCASCWDREMPEEPDTTTLYINGEAHVTAIKDSGDRTEFETGAVRDMREGKGRCDLMPLEVVSKFIGQWNDRSEAVTWNLSMFQNTNSTSYLYSALGLFGDVAWKDQYSMFLEVAKHFEDGAKKYGENNWQKGIPVHCYIDSAVRHYLKWLRGDKDEPHDRAFVWNIMCCIWEVDYHKESTEVSQ